MVYWQKPKPFSLRLRFKLSVVGHSHNLCYWFHGPNKSMQSTGCHGWMDQQIWIHVSVSMHTTLYHRYNVRNSWLYQQRLWQHSSDQFSLNSGLLASVDVLTLSTWVISYTLQLLFFFIFTLLIEWSWLCWSCLSSGSYDASPLTSFFISLVTYFIVSGFTIILY